MDSLTPITQKLPTMKKIQKRLGQQLAHAGACSFLREGFFFSLLGIIPSISKDFYLPSENPSKIAAMTTLLLQQPIPGTSVLFNPCTQPKIFSVENMELS